MVSCLFLVAHAGLSFAAMSRPSISSMLGAFYLPAVHAKDPKTGNKLVTWTRKSLTC